MQFFLENKFPLCQQVYIISNELCKNLEYLQRTFTRKELSGYLNFHASRGPLYKSSYILIGRKNIEQYYCRKQNYILSSHWLIDPRLNEFTILINFYLAWILLSTISGSVWSLSLFNNQVSFFLGHTVGYSL